MDITMIDTRKHLYIGLLLTAAMLSGCTAETSLERNAHHTASQIAKLHFDPNTRPLTADNYRIAKQFLSQFYELGKQDRAAGLSEEQAQQRVNSFTAVRQTQQGDQIDESCTSPFSAAAQKSNFLKQSFSADRPQKRAEIMLESATKSYWDGFNGRL
ncbi:Exc2 family lipoprotein [Pantoea sp. USHLN298]|uniref:Exc2 family lipoprotein n=1 Tax=Pantoea sp. USHLN298 TaxID=3081294 RepID=UPI003015E794